jgi:hypothetical protein
MTRLMVVLYLDEVQERSCGKREQRQGSLVAAGKPGLPAVGPAGACRIDAYLGAGHGSADVPEGERPVDGGVDGELGAGQRPDGGDSPPSRPSDGLDGRVESLAPMDPVTVPRSKK